MAGQDMGERIRICREACGYSQAWLAKELGVDRSTVFRYENGSTQRIAASTVEKIAVLLGTTREYLLYGQESPEQKSTRPASESPRYVASPLPTYDMLFRESQIDQITFQRMRAMRKFRFLIETDILAPRILPGDVLTVEVSDTLQNQKLHLLIQEDRFLLRRISCEGGVVILIANDGTAEILNQDKLQKNYQLVGYVTHLSSDRP